MNNDRPANPENFPNRYPYLGMGRDKRVSRPLSFNSLNTLVMTKRQTTQIEKIRNKEAVTAAWTCLVSVMLISPMNSARPNSPTTIVTINMIMRQRMASSMVKRAIVDVCVNLMFTATCLR